MTCQPTITLNGEPYPVASPLALDQLLATLDLTGKPVVVELNSQPVFPRDYPRTLVAQGDRLEIVTLAAGG